MHRLRVLAADDQLHIRMQMEARLDAASNGVFRPEVEFAECAEEAVEKALNSVRAERPFDLVLLDIDYSQSALSKGGDGHWAAVEIRSILPRSRIVLVSALGGIEHQTRAHKSPAVDQMLNRTEFTDQTLFLVSIWALLTRLHAQRLVLPPERTIYTASPVMEKYLERLDRIRPDAHVVIYGETGTGKELSARRLNANSKLANGQKERPLADLNCGEIPETLIDTKLFGYVRGAFTGAHQDTPGLLDEANGGDLYLDELQSAPRKLQQVLMRALQEKAFRPVGSQRLKKLDVRFIAALNKNLNDMKDDGTLMPDFVARLQQDYLEIPPLRERIGDIPMLVGVFLKRLQATDRRLSPEALQLLSTFVWRENVRAVERVCMAAATHCKVPIISAEMLLELPVVRKLAEERLESDATDAEAPSAPAIALTPEAMLEAAVEGLVNRNLTYQDALDQFERIYFKKMMLLEPKSVLQVSKRLGVKYNTLRDKLRRHGFLT